MPTNILIKSLQVCQIYLISSFINEKLENSTSGISFTVDLPVSRKTPICEKRPKQSKNEMIVIFLYNRYVQEIF